MKRTLTTLSLVAALAATACTAQPEPVSGSDDTPVARITVMPEESFWGDVAHFRVISCNPLTLEVDEASNRSLWDILQEARWACYYLYGDPLGQG